MKHSGEDANERLTARLNELMDLLLHWNSRINLVAAGPREVLWQRHFVDSLQLGSLLPAGAAPIADLGSGAGFPGLIIAMMSRGPIHLVEADRRKAAFLTEASARLAITNVQVHACRAETIELPPMQVVTARGLAPLTKLLPLTNRLLTAIGGIAIFPKGATAEQELSAVAGRWDFQVERFASETDAKATILRLSHIRPVPDAV